MRHLRRTLGAAALLTVLSLATAGCGSDSPATATATTAPAAAATVPTLTGSPTLVTPAGAAALVAQPAPPVVLDVRTPEEFAAGHLAGAQNLDVRSATFADDVAALDRATTYLVYCHSGNRSATATATMAGLGFTEVYELQGGIAAWEAAGYPVSS